MNNYEYSKIAIPIKSKGRIYNEKTSELRPPYQRDRDRVIHSTAFRRLKHKTQVFVNTDIDYYRTRITHSLEVSQIARTFAKIFNLNEDLCETLSLAHDLGHPPFGHAGEEILDECMQNFYGFDHNIQTLRIVTTLENKYYKFKGLNLTLETLDGLVKHNGPVNDKIKYDNILGKNIFKNKINFLNSPSLESQFSSISDDIYKHKKKYKSKDKELILNEVIRDIINTMVKDVIRNTKNNLIAEKPKKIKDIYKSNIRLVEFSQKMQEFDTEIKYFLKINMYKHKLVFNKARYGMKILNTLFKKVINNPKKYIKNKFFYNFSKERMVCDFIAGMTDRYAINLYNSIK